MAKKEKSLRQQRLEEFDRKIEKQNAFIIGLVFNIALSMITTLLVLRALGITAVPH